MSPDTFVMANPVCIEAIHAGFDEAMAALQGRYGTRYVGSLVDRRFEPNNPQTLHPSEETA